jgi:hypothetical protein
MPVIPAAVTVQDFGEDLYGLHDRGSGTIEVQIAIRYGDSSRPYGFELAPARQGLEQGELAHRSGDVVAAGSDDEEVRVGVENFLPGDGAGELPLLAEQDLAVGGFDEFGSPVAHGKDRVGPFEHDDGRCGLVAHRVGDGTHAGAHRRDKVFACGLEMQAAGDAANAVKDAVDSSSTEGQDLRGQDAAADSLDVVGSDRADFAVHLGDEQVGMEVADAVSIDVVEGFVQAEATSHFRVDLAARHVDVEGRAGAGGQGSHPLWVVAFMGTAHQRIASAECADDLGSAGEKGKDAHGKFSLVRAGVLLK